MVQLKAYGQALIKTHLTVTKIVDGDGLIVQNMFNQEEEEIRLIGIDAPEIKRSRKLLQDERETHLPGQLLLELGFQSKEFLSTIVPVGSIVTIQMEKKHCYDTYGRTLAYVFLKDGTCVNEVMIKEGFAKPYSRYYCEALSEFQRFSLEARVEKRGFYKDVPVF
jgi:micrococcal nuclease